MANSFLWTNNAISAIAASISNVATSVTLTTGSGALFPNPGANQQFAMTFTDAATGLLNEIVYCTSRTGDVLTIVRAQESTTALAWSAGDVAAALVTAGNLAGFTQPNALALAVQAQAGNYAGTTTGSVDAYVFALVPVLLARVVGMPIRLKFNITNTGAAATINDGLGAVQLARPGGADLFPTDVTAGILYTIYWDGTRYCVDELLGAALSGTGIVTPNAGVVVPNDAANHKIFDVNRFGSRRATFSIGCTNNSTSANYNATIIAQQFATTTTPANISAQNTPGTVAFAMSNQDVLMSITGGSGSLTVNAVSLGAF